MKKLTVAILMALTFNSYAQMESPLLICEPDKVDNYGFSFTAKFDDKTATVSFKGWTYSLPYSRASVSTTGERWAEYGNTELRVTTNYPLKKFVAIFVPDSIAPITRSNCE
jgi:hypothetical protein